MAAGAQQLGIRQTMTSQTGEQIRERREALGLSQKELADRARTSARTIWAIENNGHLARPQTMARIRAELEIPGDEEEARVDTPVHVQVVAAAVADLLTTLEEPARLEWAHDLSLRVVADDARMTGRSDWPLDVQIVTDMLIAYLTRDD